MNYGLQLMVVDKQMIVTVENGGSGRFPVLDTSLAATWEQDRLPGVHPNDRAPPPAPPGDSDRWCPSPERSPVPGNSWELHELYYTCPPAILR